MPWNPYRDRAEEAALDAERLAREAHEPLLDHHSLDAPGARTALMEFAERVWFEEHERDAELEPLREPEDG